MRIINFINRDIEIIAMTLIDNCICGRLNKHEYNLAWNILERLYEPIKLSKENLTLICNSLRRYAIKYEHEVLEVSECKRVYTMILEDCRYE